MGLFSRKKNKNKQIKDFKADASLMNNMSIDVEDASIFEFNPSSVDTVAELVEEKVVKLGDKSLEMIFEEKEKCYMPEELIIEEPPMEESLEKLFMKEELKKVEEKEEKKIQEEPVKSRAPVENKKELYMQNNKKYIFDFSNCKNFESITFYDKDEKLITVININYNLFQKSFEFVFMENGAKGPIRLQTLKVYGERMKLLVNFSKHKLDVCINNKAHSSLKRQNNEMPVKAIWTHDCMNVV